MDRFASLEIASRKLATQLHLTLWRHQYSLISNRSDPSNASVKTAPFCDGRVVAVHSLPVARCTCIAVILGVDKQPSSSSDNPEFRVLALTTSPPNEEKEKDTDDGDDARRRQQVKKLIRLSRNAYGRFYADKVATKVLKSGFLRSSVLDDYSPGASFGYHLIS